MSLLRRTAAPLLGLGTGVLAWSTLVEPRWFALRRCEAAVLPPEARPLRVLHLSDLHLVPRQRRKIDWVRGLAALRPDLVVTTGDNMADQHAVPALVEAYGELLEMPGAFVLGSNDYFPPVLKNPLRYVNDSHQRGGELTTGRLPTAELVSTFRDAGWIDLTNRRVRLEVAGVDLELVGVDDPHLGYDDLGAVRGPAAPGADLTVGLTHAPYRRVLDAMTTDGAGLVLAGHTHGGQVCVPFYGALVTNCDLPTSQAKGLSSWRGVPLHVSAGLGCSPYSTIRLACRPEATLLTLRPR